MATTRPRELLAPLGRRFPLPPAREVLDPVCVDRIGEELHRCPAARAPAFLVVAAGDLVGNFREVVGQVSVAEADLADVPAVLLGGVEAVALQRPAPAAERESTDGLAH